MRLRSSSSTLLVLVAGAVAGTVVGCAAPAAPPPAPGAPAAQSSPTTSTTSTTSTGSTDQAAPPSGDLGPCLDGDCTVTVRSGTAIRVAPEFEIDQVVIDDVGDGRARISIEPSDGGSITASGSGPRSSYNDLTVRVERVVGDRAVVSLESD